MSVLLMLLWFHIFFGASWMIRVVLSALFGFQLRLSYFVTRRPEIWDRAPYDGRVHDLRIAEATPYPLPAGSGFEFISIKLSAAKGEGKTRHYGGHRRSRTRSRLPNCHRRFRSLTLRQRLTLLWIWPLRS